MWPIPTQQIHIWANSALINQTYNSLDCGRKLEAPEETLADAAKIC